jgi:hypothetical protein
MRIPCWWLIGLLVNGLSASGNSNPPIDRRAVVSRHDIDWLSLDGQIPLGNGNFAFNADGTGLETVGGNTMCHWCWHSFPLPPGVTPSQIRPWATPDHGRMTQPLTSRDPEPIYDWERLNPQPLNLGRIGFINQEGERLTGADVHMDSRHLELWTGILTSHFTYLGEPVWVQTCVDPKSDRVAVKVESPLLRDGRLQVMLDFAAPAQQVGAWVGDYSQVGGHQTTIVRQTPERIQVHRTIDDIQYDVLLSGRGFVTHQPAAIYPEIKSARYGAEGGGWTNVTFQVAGLLHEHRTVPASNDLFGDPAYHHSKQLVILYRLDGKERTRILSENDSWITGTPSPHQFILAPTANTEAMDFTCLFGTNAAVTDTTSFEQVKSACAISWPAFWKSGGAVDLSGSHDSRWMELERRIVLSQYELAAQSAGDNPPAEAGLTGTDPWDGKWHFEMIWWHLANYALWDRWPMAEKALSIYARVTPVARAIANNFNYQGLMWPKSTGPNGYNDGYPIEMSLLWKEPHPICFAELDYRLHPTPATLAKWKNIVFGTADFMADYPTRDPVSGIYNLAPIFPASEGESSPLRTNTVFEIAYWHVGLNLAQQWRLRLGLPREPHWDEVASHLAPLPEKDGLYVFSNYRSDTFTTRTFDHVDNIGIAGMLPPFPGLDSTMAKRTVEEVGRSWNWDATWGWDFPWMAMAAARVGDPKLAVEALLNPSEKNHYDERGICTGGPGPYLPGNGGLLYAVAMMVAGWDGAPHRNAPGFPDDGSWTVHWEGLKPAP